MPEIFLKILKHRKIDNIYEDIENNTHFEENLVYENIMFSFKF